MTTPAVLIKAFAASAAKAMREHRYEDAREALRAIDDPRTHGVVIEMMLLVTEHELVHQREQEPNHAPL